MFRIVIHRLALVLLAIGVLSVASMMRATRQMVLRQTPLAFVRLVRVSLWQNRHSRLSIPLAMPPVLVALCGPRDVMGFASPARTGKVVRWAHITPAYLSMVVLVGVPSGDADRMARAVRRRHRPSGVNVETPSVFLKATAPFAPVSGKWGMLAARRDRCARFRAGQTTLPHIQVVPHNRPSKPWLPAFSRMLRPERGAPLSADDAVDWRRPADCDREVAGAVPPKRHE